MLRGCYNRPRLLITSWITASPVIALPQQPLSAAATIAHHWDAEWALTPARSHEITS